MKICLLLLLVGTTLSATTTGTMYNCFKDRKCFDDVCNQAADPPFDEKLAAEMNGCESAVTSRDLCLVMNNCTFTDDQQYSYDCWHCWTGIVTNNNTFYDNLVNCINPCYAWQSRMWVALAMMLMLLYV